ncbi:hypothetical protein [Heliorestis convoluta]|uniref:Putative membrane protein n=1 Tax=Heliorestis convoluta TaxID=356322 RepID=A0A5Q2N3P1_9FIRM|nr:hypothetical protein [Heliorestis convoluta]QGG49427.1 putative membrane protein [Heliorestis convoluta]
MRNICKIALFALAGMHLAKPFVGVDLTIPLFVVTVLVFITGIQIMDKGFRLITFIFLGIGILLLFWYDHSFITWAQAANSLTNVVAIVAIMQLFAIPITIGEYDKAIRYWISRSSQGEKGLFLLTTTGTHFLTSLLMFGSIPVMISILGNTLKNCVSHYQKFIATATSRGYGLAALWAPGAINLFLVMQATGVAWSSIVLPGLLLAFIGIFLSYFLEKKLSFASNNEAPIQIDQGNLPRREARNKIVHLIVVLASLIAFVVLFDQRNIGAATNRVMLAVALVTLLWTILHLSKPSFSETLRNYWNKDALKTIDLAPFLIAMGLFSGALEQSGFMIILQYTLQSYVNGLGLSAVAVIPLAIIATSLVGIHPFITIVMFGKILTPIELPFSDISLALCLALGGSISYIISPFAGVTIAIAKYLDSSIRDVSIRWNWLFVLLYFIVGVLFAYYWGAWIE